jgi:deoxyadenosine/deoxycytidine kinase
VKRYVAVAGTIGAGKTSLVQWLVKRYGLTPFYEPNETNPYLSDFYADMTRWAFHSQCFFLAHKLELHQELERAAKDAKNTSCVIDRTLYEDAEIFAKNLYAQGLMQKREWDVYRHLYEGIRKALRPPDVMIALTCPMRTTKKRIAQRGRAMEAAIPDEYLRRLHRLYAQWFATYDLSPIVHVDTGKIDYVEDLVDLLELTKTLNAALA